jgi:hypothetical protein
MKSVLRVLFALFLLGVKCLSVHPSGAAGELPVDLHSLEKNFREESHHGIRNLISLDQIWSIVKSGKTGLEIDLSGVRNLLDGSSIQPSAIYGTAYAGPYPFEAEESQFAYKRFRLKAKIQNGSAVLPLERFFKGNANSEDWTSKGRLVIRLDLMLETPGRDKPLGVYDTFAFFRKTVDGFQRLPSIVEGPLVHMIRSEDPSRCVISLRTDVPVKAAIVLNDGRQYRSVRPSRQHEITLNGLRPAKRYRYRALVEEMSTREYTFRTAPLPGETSGNDVTFAYAGDSREGIGGGMQAFMGSNHAILERLMAQAYSKGAAFLLMGGDMLNGNTTSTADMRVQYHSWKQATVGFWHERPIYGIMGNHENMLRVFDDGSKEGIRFDRWPYGVEDSQTLFAEVFVNPTNGPDSLDPRRPSYRETVYSFQYGRVKIIGFNNNYWAVKGSHQFGGAPEGYVLTDQLEWIKNELIKAEKSPTVHHVFLFAHEPLFPNGGHVKDAMWWHGNNNVRASSLIGGSMAPEKKGIIEVRNELVRAIAASSKVAAVLCSDEHGYHRTLLGPQVPIGNPSEDDIDGDGRLEKASPLSHLKYRTWYLVCGGGGAPYYSEEPTPWNRYWKEKNTEGKSFSGYYYSSQANILIFRATGRGVSVKVYNPYGECLDEIENLMAAKYGELH